MKHGLNYAKETDVKRRIMATLSIILGLQLSTQIFAHLFNYHEALGSSFYNIYFPWSILIWFTKWPKEYYYELVGSASSGLFFIAFGFLCSMLSTTKNAKLQYKNLHGSARWANVTDIKKASLIDNNAGVYVGGWVDSQNKLHYLRHNGPEHVLTYAPTRSGKGLGLVIPTLLSWPHSVLITDLKGELWAITAGWRQKYAKNKVILFEPASSQSAAINPIDVIRRGTDFEIGDIQNLANIIVDPDGKGLESHWDKTAYSLIIGLIAHAMYKGLNEGFSASLPYIDSMIADPDKSFNELLTEMLHYKHVNGQTLSIVALCARDMLDKAEEEAKSVLSTVKSFLSLYRDPVIAKNISSSDFSIHDLMNHESPVSLYLVTQPVDKDRLRPLIRLVLSMIVRITAKRMEFERVFTDDKGLQKKIFSKSKKKYKSVVNKKTYKHRLLCMIDEFPSLGKLDIIQECLSYIAGYGVKFYLICQDINQLKGSYGINETITSNCHIQNAFPPNRIETAKHLSILVGETTVIKDQITISGKRIGLMQGQISKTQQEVKRALLTEDECLRMPSAIKDKQGRVLEAGDMLIYANGIPMIYGKQILYFKDPIFIERASIDAPSKSDELRKKYSANEINHEFLSEISS